MRRERRTQEAPREPSRQRMLVVDRRRWVASAVYFDVLALATLLVSGGGLAVNIFAAGTNVVEPGAEGVHARLAALGMLFTLSFAWVATRLLGVGFREATIVGRR